MCILSRLGHNISDTSDVSLGYKRYIYSTHNNYVVIVALLTVLCVCVCVCSTGLYDYYDDVANKLTVLSIPLAHKKSSVVFIMPYNVEPLERVEKLLSGKQLDTWVAKLEEKAVAVSLPKISSEVSHNLQVSQNIQTSKRPWCSVYIFQFRSLWRHFLR